MDNVTDGLEHRFFSGNDLATMLREIADYLDVVNPGRLVIGLWAVPGRDDGEGPNGFGFEVIIDHDESWHQDYPSTTKVDP